MLWIRNFNNRELSVRSCAQNALQTLFDICLISVWYLFDICLISVWYLFLRRAFYCFRVPFLPSVPFHSTTFFLPLYSSSSLYSSPSIFNSRNVADSSVTSFVHSHYRIFHAISEYSSSLFLSVTWSNSQWRIADTLEYQSWSLAHHFKDTADCVQTLTKRCRVCK